MVNFCKDSWNWWIDAWIDTFMVCTMMSL